MLSGQIIVSYTQVQSVVLQWHGLDSSQHRSLHQAFGSLLTDWTKFIEQTRTIC